MTSINQDLINKVAIYTYLRGQDSYDNSPIGDGNPYYSCDSCGVSDPAINGYLFNHSPFCEHLKKVLLPIVDEKNIDKLYYHFSNYDEFSFYDNHQSIVLNFLNKTYGLQFKIKNISDVAKTKTYTDFILAFFYLKNQNEQPKITKNSDIIKNAVYDKNKFYSTVTHQLNAMYPSF